MLENKLALGTAQFGMPYGITNKRGQIPVTEILNIIDEAHNKGIRIIDTAAAYGNAEGILGKLELSKEFRIITKIRTKNSKDVHSSILRSMAALQLKHLDTILLHSFEQWSSDTTIWSAMYSCLEEGLVSKIGLSLYYPEEWHRFSTWIDNNKSRKIPDIVQIPLSIFDQRFVPVLADMKERKIEIHIRSVFLQGLGFIEPDNVPANMSILNQSLKKLQKIQEEVELTRLASLLLFPFQFSEIDYIVIGVDSYNSFCEILSSYDQVVAHFANEGFVDFSDCRIDNEDIIIPSNWKK